MLTVTESALRRLIRKLTRKKAADETAMRFTAKKGGWRLSLDRQGPNDTVFAHRGRSVLLLDQAVARAMAHKTLDTRNTAAGPRLTLH